MSTSIGNSATEAQAAISAKIAEYDTAKSDLVRSNINKGQGVRAALSALQNDKGLGLLKSQLEAMTIEASSKYGSGIINNSLSSELRHTNRVSENSPIKFDNAYPDRIQIAPTIDIAKVDIPSKTSTPAPTVLKDKPPKALNASADIKPVESSTKGTQINPEAYKAPGITDYQAGRRPKPFGWLEEYIDPTMFASSDACLLTIGCSKKELNEDGSMGKVLGFCDNISFSLSNTVITLKELRAERTILIPGKANAGNLSLARVICKGESVTNFLGVVSKEGDRRLRYDNQLRIAKKPFGIGVVMFSSIGKKELTTFYIEQCVINAISVPIGSKQYSLYENINISFNRIVDL